jgi:hypothetical protein
VSGYEEIFHENLEDAFNFDSITKESGRAHI